jgi:hypothetical protein
MFPMTDEQTQSECEMYGDRFKGENRKQWKAGVSQVSGNPTSGSPQSKQVMLETPYCVKNGEEVLKRIQIYELGSPHFQSELSPLPRRLSEGLLSMSSIDRLQSGGDDLSDAEFKKEAACKTSRWRRVSFDSRTPEIETYTIDTASPVSSLSYQSASLQSSPENRCIV